MSTTMRYIYQTTAAGLVLLGTTAALAEHNERVVSDTIISDPDGRTTDARTSDSRHNDLAGGFYDDKYTIDNWYYDFYETPSVQRGDPRFSERREAEAMRTDDTRLTRHPSGYQGDTMRTGHAVRYIDAARPFALDKSANRAPSTAYSRYYDEAWYYDQRDPAYVMPQRTMREESDRPVGQLQEKITGQVADVKQVRNRTAGGQNTVVLLKAADGTRTIADLGPTPPLLDLALAKGDRITVGGSRDNIGQYPVLMANHIKSGSNHVTLDREGAYRGDVREVNGRIEKFHDVSVRGTAQQNRTAAVRTDDGNFVLVDLGPSAAQNVPANAAPGDTIRARGSVAQIGQYPVLLADQFEINNSLPVRVARPGEAGARRPWEASHEVNKSQPGDTGDGMPRRPSSNATDGTTTR